jgi:hypothetical protein
VIGTLDKELYLGKRRSRVIADAIAKSGRQIPYEIEIGLHYSYLKAMDRIKKDRENKVEQKEQNIETDSTSGSKKVIKW